MKASKKRLTGLLLLAVLIVSFQACTTQKRAFTWMDAHPVQAAKYSLSRFPIRSDTIRLAPVITHISDTVVIPGDTIDCPPATKEQPVPRVICPPSRIIHDTFKIHDKEIVNQERPEKDIIIADLNVQKQNLQEDNDRLKNKVTKRNYIILILCLTGVAGIGLFLKHFRA